MLVKGGAVRDPLARPQSSPRKATTPLRAAAAIQDGLLLQEPDRLQEYLMDAAKGIDQRLHLDGKLPELWDLLEASSSRDYSTDGPAVFKKEKLIVLPDVLYEQYNLVECKCFMGLFPAIDRAWLSIDNRLFLWNYKTGNDFFASEKFSDVVIGVALVTPRKDVFVKNIEFLLSVATPTEVCLLGVSFERDVMRTGRHSYDAAIQVHDTGLAASTDGVSMLAVTGTRSGRIFAAGNDGNVFEVLYESREGWFTRRCRLRNLTAIPLVRLLPSFLRLSANDPIMSLCVAESKGLLFSLSAASTICAFTLTCDGATKFASITGVCKQARGLCPRTSLLNPEKFCIIGIHAVDPLESNYVSLVAVTSNGFPFIRHPFRVRLYFSTVHRSARSLDRSQLGRMQRPHSVLDLVHVRLPPEQLSQAHGVRRFANEWNTTFHVSHYSGGVLLAANAVSEDEDSILLTSPNEAALQRMRPTGCLELSTDVTIEGKTWAIAEEPRRVHTHNDLLTQHSAPPRRFLILTNSGISMVLKVRPVDHLRYILIDSAGQDTETLHFFFSNYGRDQACAMCLQLACEKSYAQAEECVQSLAAYALFKYCGEATFSSTVSAGSAAAAAAYRPDSAFGRALPAPEIAFSGVRNGLFIRVARLLRPIWRARLQDFTHDSEAASDLSTQLLLSVQSQLLTLNDFFRRNPNLTVAVDAARKGSAGGLHEGVHAANVRDDDPFSVEGDLEARRAEQLSIMSLALLVSHCVEAISFTLFIVDFNFAEAVRRNQAAFSTEIQTLDFETLVASPDGRDCARDLLTAIIQRQLEYGADVDPICELLQQRCPSFCSLAEVTLYKGIEGLQRAQKAHRAEVPQLVADATQALLRSAAVIPFANFEDICRRLIALEHYEGVVALAVRSAELCDLEHHGLDYFRDLMLNGAAAVEHDARRTFYRERERYYAAVTTALASLEDRLSDRRLTPGPDLDRLEAIQRHLYTQIRAQDDELCHAKFYEWLIAAGKVSSLIEERSIFLERFLAAYCGDQEAPICDILWKYHARHGDHLAAARILANLAAGPGRFGLAQRIEYLSLACSNANSVADASAEFSELEEKLEVATVQAAVLQAVSGHAEVSPEHKGQLEGTLFDLTTLYNRFTRPLQLHECSLLILHCSRFTDDASVVAGIWQQLYEGDRSHPLESFGARVEAIGRRLHPSPYAFPIAFMTGFLTRIALERRDEGTESWPASVLESVGVPPVDIAKHLDIIFDSRTSPWHTPNALTFLLRALLALLSSSKIHVDTSKYVSFLESVGDGGLAAAFKAVQV